MNFSNLSIKKQFYYLIAFILLSFVGLFFIVHILLSKVEDKSIKLEMSDKIVKKVLDARTDEKNFIIFKDMKYYYAVKKSINKSLEHAKKLDELFNDPKNQKLVEEINSYLKEYLKDFSEYVALQKEADKNKKIMVKEAKDVLESAITATNKLEEQLKKLIESKNPKVTDKFYKFKRVNEILTEMYEIRLAEKNFIARKDFEYVKQIDKRSNNILNILKELKGDFNSPKNRALIKEIINSLKNYKNAIIDYSKVREKRMKLLDEMRQEAKDLENVSNTLSKEQRKQMKELEEDIRIDLAIAFIILGGILFVVLMYILKKGILPIEKASNELANAQGDLTKRVNVSGKNEIAEIANNINHFIEEVQNVVNSSKHVSNEVSVISKQLVATSDDIKQRITNEVNLIKDIKESVNQTNEEADFVDDVVNRMYKISDDSEDLLNNAIKQINLLVDIVKESGDKEQEVISKMQDLKNSAESIKNVLTLISEVAEQTNLLSLNAAIEAARAGEHGRGFAVVADEVRKLAERTQNNLNEINATINIVTSTVEDTAAIIAENAKEIEKAVNQAGEVEGRVDEVMNSMQESKKMAKESTNAVNNLKVKVTDVNNKTNNLSDISDENYHNVNEMINAVSHQNQEVHKLHNELNKFKS